MPTDPNDKATPSTSAADAEARLLKAMENPIRARALSIINEGLASPKMIAAELDLPVGTVGHHVRRLEALGCIELAKTEPRRGATEHFYRSLVDASLNEEQWAMLSPDTQRALSCAWMEMLRKGAHEAIDAETFDARSDRHLSRMPVTLDEQGWKEVTSLLGDTSGGVQEIATRSWERMRSDSSIGGPMRATIALLCFESAPASGGAAADA